MPRVLDSTTTPMMRQYLDVKAQHEDAVVFFRLGDFYEMFYEDAELAARELELTLTGRGSKEHKMPMCGVPYHAAESYISRLINKGYKVAICEQVEDPALAKGLTKREVIKVITPGTLIDEKLLPGQAANYLAAIVTAHTQEARYGLAFADISTGVFRAAELYCLDNLRTEVLRIDPRELIYTDAQNPLDLEIASTRVETPGLPAARKILAHFAKDTARDFDLENKPLALQAAAAVFNYFKAAQKTELQQLTRLETYLPQNYMHLDSASRKNLELTETIRYGGKNGSLYGLFDQTKTSMGSRLLKEWLCSPLLNKDAIEARYAAVGELLGDLVSRAELAELLKDIYDIERLIGRITNGNANARDLVYLKESLRVIHNLAPILQQFSAPLLQDLNDPSLRGPLQNICTLIDQAIVDDPPLLVSGGHIFRDGYHAELDELRQISQAGKTWIAAQEAKERERTGIKSLKIGYNSVFGYYIEISHANRGLAPKNYIRKQTLTGAERYITPELKEKEEAILNASSRLQKLEHHLFTELRRHIAAHTLPIQQIARKVAVVDALLAFAETAAARHFVRPTILDDDRNSLHIKNGRHPVVEQALGTETFIPNDLYLAPEENRLLLLFGPNMSGKSTYMRQAALLVLLAQAGSFVPAESMEFALVDRLFTRVGAMDDLFSGKSTFMVEMAETANIVRNATKRSLIILDEVGRGTSTYDGMAIAWALSEYICLRIGAKTIFATHYHELAQLAAKYPYIRNFNVSVEESGPDIVFLHKVVPGTAGGSYGIHVARLAGLPAEITNRATEILATLETPQKSHGQLNLF
ncbi:DNA mismatch repair protein MutS [Candidatus Termititenax persephonae]|uniref:DNA mismatch repair protein MutS n=1 Tax=Candidatus Termititenax persephonae TaxID=2218525 RepID=A0A388TIN3_9BACT|nr:DNA mismatch repair protein MutS [Candidatus Termititenax persephonae]